ncbi:FAD-dependent oxidoreductase [Caballeronia sp. INDeC2]|uniref:NAD(P)/FAD-dependent oxidoreductase n=1 Tax=Caballeronia sp. INDeC2 TaxID=2921747 RepID=UPI0020289982|nr:FAD-dependent oxidoreductase [Caballeronia sp. INDeC2]
MTKRLLIIGAGFAGMCSALSAARAVDQTGHPNELEIVVLAPEARLNIRPRFFEADLSDVSASLVELFDVAGVRFVKGLAEQINHYKNLVIYRNGSIRESIHYNRLILATGTHLPEPVIRGFGQYNFNNDRLPDAERLQRHLVALSELPNTPSRNTVVVVGGGFAGIETAAEFPSRLREVLGKDTPVQVIVVEPANAIGFGSGSRTVIEQALATLGIYVRSGVSVIAIDSDGVVLSDNSRIDSQTVVWTADRQASELTRQIPAEHDPLGRLNVSPELRVIGQECIFAAGDTAYLATDNQPRHTLVSCQHDQAHHVLISYQYAMTMGRYAGHNAAAELLHIPTIPCDRVNYMTCLGIGPWESHTDPRPGSTGQACGLRREKAEAASQYSLALPALR